MLLADCWAVAEWDQAFIWGGRDRTCRDNINIGSHLIHYCYHKTSRFYYLSTQMWLVLFWHSVSQLMALMMQRKCAIFIVCCLPHKPLAVFRINWLFWICWHWHIERGVMSVINLSMYTFKWRKGFSMERVCTMVQNHFHITDCELFSWKLNKQKKF